MRRLKLSFSIVDLMIIMAILMILAGMLVPFFSASHRSGNGKAVVHTGVVHTAARVSPAR